MAFDLLGLGAERAEIGVEVEDRGIDLAQDAGSHRRRRQGRGGGDGNDRTTQGQGARAQRNDRIGVGIGDELNVARQRPVEDVRPVERRVFDDVLDLPQDRLEVAIERIARGRVDRRVHRADNLFAQLVHQIGNAFAGSHRHVCDRRRAVKAVLDGIKSAQVGPLPLSNSVNRRIVLSCRHRQAG